MSSTTRKETERTKLIQEKCQTLLTQMLRDEDNKYCVDCDAKGPRWASWNLGVFLCIRCAGIHRNLGVHISRVKSVNLDAWTPEQVISLQQMGNSRARAVYEAQLPDGFRRPQTDTALESFIRAKYEHKKYLAREWVPPSPPKVDWAKEIDEELDRQKRKKKAAQGNNSLGIGSVSMTSGSDKKSSSNALGSAKSSPLPAPLPKPKPHQVGGSSPKSSSRISTSSTNGGENDLLGLSSPTKPNVGGGVAVQDLHNDSFSNFLSAAAVSPPQAPTQVQHATSTNGKGDINQSNSLAQQEQEFFNQGSLGNGGVNAEKDKSGKLSKDSILALYGTAQTTHNQPQINFAAFTGMAPGYQQQQQQPQHQQQFMTPPNSVSMYNAPVMTAPNAFSAPQMSMGGAAGGGFGAQFPSSAVGYTGLGLQGAPAGGATNVVGGGNINLMQTNQSLLSGMSLYSGAGIGGVPQHGIGASGIPTMAGVGHQAPFGGLGNLNVMQQPMAIPAGPSLTAGVSNSNNVLAGAFQTPNVNAATSAAASTANLNQQFGNLNIGNVWQ